MTLLGATGGDAGIAVINGDDVIGAGIRAYVDALNKICYEENN